MAGYALPPLDAAHIAKWLWIAFFAGWMLAAVRTKRVVRRLSLPSRLAHLVPAILSFYLIAGDPLPWPLLQRAWAPRSPELQIAGLAMVVAGLGIAVWARIHLRGNWSGNVTLKENHELIRTGPYARVRHPIYSGMLLAMAGTALVQTEIRGLLALALLFLAFWIKSRYEEHLMRQTFGSAYDDYCTSTGALLPRLSVSSGPPRRAGS